MAGAKRGPKVGSKSIKQRAIKQARAAGILPHEWLLKVCRGDMIEQRTKVCEYYKSGTMKGMIKSEEWVLDTYYPTFPERLDAAKHASPYYAPRLATQATVLVPDKEGKTMGDLLVDIANKLPD